MIKYLGKCCPSCARVSNDMIPKHIYKHKPSQASSLKNRGIVTPKLPLEARERPGEAMRGGGDGNDDDDDDDDDD